MTVEELIAQSYGQDAAKAFRAFEPSQADIEALQQVGREMQIIFKPIPGACIVMSALAIDRLRSLTKAPCYLVAGALSVGGTRVFGTNKVDMSAFRKSTLDWDGHAWVQSGKYVFDTSIFRTAHSSRKVLRRWQNMCGPQV